MTHQKRSLRQNDQEKTASDISKKKSPGRAIFFNDNFLLNMSYIKKGRNDHAPDDRLNYQYS